MTNARGLVNVHLTLSAAYELAITKSIWVPLIWRRLAWPDVYGDPLIFQPDGALIYGIDRASFLPGTRPPISACSVPLPFSIAPFITCLGQSSTKTCLPSTQTRYTRCKSGEQCVYVWGGLLWTAALLQSQREEKKVEENPGFLRDWFATKSTDMCINKIKRSFYRLKKKKSAARGSYGPHQLPDVLR